MQLLDRLLAGVSPQDLKDYESYVQLHLKQILTTINKNKLEDMTDIKVISATFRSKSTNVMWIATNITAKKKEKVLSPNESNSWDPANKNVETNKNKSKSF